MLNNAKAVEGGNNQLLLAVEQFHPQVTCQGPLDSAKRSCGEIISNIPKTYRLRRFGRLRDRTADYPLPFDNYSRKNSRIPNYGQH